MQVLLKLVMILSVLLITSQGIPVRKKVITYVTKPGQPSNIHYIVKKPLDLKDVCDDGQGKAKRCQTAEIIKVPLRDQGCPKNHKRDSSGRCRLSWS